MVKRRKVKASRKEESLRIRVTTAQKERFTAEAEKAGFTLSAWLIGLATKASG
jgi:hypothetical protein